MTRHGLQILSAFVFILLLVQCAQIVPLSGGKKDTTPPKLIEAIPARNSTEFNTDLITLRFDEFVQVKDLSNQLIVTPRLKTAPDITADGKKVLVKFKKEELKPNTTYRIFFGKAIADMNESNSIPDFEYVFSTGKAIDTLEVKGSVDESFDNKPVTEALVGLYLDENVNDSLPYKKEPDYFVRSGEGGRFVIKNLPSRSFKAYAFTDKNKNSLYDGDAEKIAFLDSALNLETDTTIHLRLFQEESPKSFVKRSNSPYFGFVQLFLNKKARVELSTLNANDQKNIFEINPGIPKDTISLYYRNTEDTLKLVLDNKSVNKIDTLKITLPKTSTRRRLRSFTLNTYNGKLALYDKIRLTFLTWMDTGKVDLSKIHFSSKEDSLVAEQPVKGHWKSITTYELDHHLKEGVNYTLKIDTNAFFDLKRFTNDSSLQNFTTQSKIEFGKLTLKLLFYKKQNYIVQLMSDQDKVVREYFISLSLSSSNAETIEFIDLLPGMYHAKIIFDDNKNKKWDSGNLIERKQPEKVMINSKQLKVLSDWEIEEEINLKE